MFAALEAIDAFLFTSDAVIRNKRGFTLIEILCVVAVVVILASVAVPNFIRYRNISQMNGCIANLRIINVAYEQATMAGETPSDVAALCGPQAYIKAIPLCPASKSNTYSLPEEEGGYPTCSNSTEEFPHALFASAAD